MLWYHCIIPLKTVKGQNGFWVQHKGVHTLSETKVAMEVNSRSLTLFAHSFDLHDSRKFRSKNSWMLSRQVLVLSSTVSTSKRFHTYSIVAGKWGNFSFFHLNFGSMGMLFYMKRKTLSSWILVLFSFAINQLYWSIRTRNLCFYVVSQHCRGI